MTTQPSDWAVAQAMREFKPVFRSTTWTHAEEWILNRARELDASFPPTHNAKVTGMRMIDGVHVIVAEGVTGEHLLVKHEDYLRARELDASAKCDCGCGRSVCPACGEDLGFATPGAAEAETTNSAQISSSLVVGDVGEDTRCRHDNGRPGYDLWHCSDCGAVKTDSGWGIAKHRYFNDRAEAEFFRKHGRLPDDGKPQPWGNAAMGAVGAGGGGE